MSQRFYQELHSTNQVERGEPTRISMRRCVNTLKARSQSMARFQLNEFLDEVFSAEGACRFFRTFILRFAFDSNGSSDDGSARLSIGALAVLPVLACI